MKINKTSVTGLLITLANPLPTMGMLSDMDDRGRMLNISLIVSASCTFGDHMAYASQALPQIVPALIFGKLVGGFSGMLLAIFLAPRLLDKNGA
jgi:ethanolamine transporter